MIKLENVSRIYTKSGTEVPALQNVSLTIDTGEFVVIRGPSGSGKSTLLLTIGAMVRPTSGHVFFDGLDLYAMSSRKRAGLRSSQIGFVFQIFHLVPYLNIQENVLLPELGRHARPRRDEARARRDEARRLIERFGLADRIGHRPSELSVGERQRVAMARALLNRPRVILADEPTGNLDPENGAEIMQYLTQYHQDGGTVVLVTHDATPEQHAQRTISIRQGKIEE